MPARKAALEASTPMQALRQRLKAAGVKSGFLDNVVLPEWWEDTLADSTAGLREAAGYIGARLGFSLPALLDANQPLTFARTGIVKYKKAANLEEAKFCLATHCALGLARTVAAGFVGKPPASAIPAPAELRQELLAKATGSWVGLRDLLAACWRRGVPVIQLRRCPPGACKPDALTTMVGDRPVIVLLCARKSPSWIAFVVAHELGHIERGHLRAGQTLVDEKIASQDGDEDERQANEFAARVLTGQTDLGLHSSQRLTAPDLARLARSFGEKYQVAPGVAALNFGFTTGLWGLANGAVALLEGEDDAAADVQRAFGEHLLDEDLSEEAQEWITRATASE